MRLNGQKRLCIHVVGFTGMHIVFRLVATQLQHFAPTTPKFCPYCLYPRSFGGRPTMVLEVEQKFFPKDSVNLESKLKQLGFSPKGSAATFVDWYFDTTDYQLSVQDCWLRYREKGGKGKWQLKRGRGHGGATVYEEIEGEEACSVAVSVLPQESSDRVPAEPESVMFDGHEAPKLPGGCDSRGLAPFCRLETTRSSWTVLESKENPYQGLTVDLDTTTSGHAVGEVEALCEESEVDAGKKRVQELICILTGEDGRSPAIGKVEHFLMKNRPLHYEACVASGVVRG